MKLVLLALASVLIVSCGGKANKVNNGSSDTDQQPFDQEKVESYIKFHLDSIANQFSSNQVSFVNDIIKDDSVRLSPDEKKVKPDYLLDPVKASNLLSANQKYAALAMLTIEESIAGMYDIDTKPYDEAIAKLTADLCDPAIEKTEKMDGSLKDKINALYDDMETEGRINFFWIGCCAATVENLYVIAQNANKFLPQFNDEKIAKITYNIHCIIEALNELSNYDSNIAGMAGTIEKLSDLNARTKSEFAEQLEATKGKLADARKALLE